MSVLHSIAYGIIDLNNVHDRITPPNHETT